MSTKIEVDQQRKLCKIFNGHIFLKKRQDSFINLSSTPVPPKIRKIFNLGMNCHLKTKSNHIRTKIEIEKLFRQITTEQARKNLIVQDEERLKCELKRFGLRDDKDFQSDLITREEYKMVGEFLENDEIVVRKADKNNTFVIMERAKYFEKLNKIVNDKKKFTHIKKDTLIT